MRGFGLAFTNSAGTRGVLNVCLCLGCGGVGGLGRKCVGACNWIWKSGVVLCLCDLRVWIICVVGRSRYLC